MYSYILGRYLDWSWLALSCTIPPLILAPLTAVSLESPRWLMQKNRKDDALEVLRKLRGSSYAAEEECHSMDVVYLNTPLPSHHLILALYAMFLQQFSGINMIIFYSTSLFREAGLAIDPAESSIILAMVQVTRLRKIKQLNRINTTAATWFLEW